MEDFFKDLYFDFQESPNDQSLRDAYTGLAQTYARVLIETTNWLGVDSRNGGPVGRLIQSAADATDELTIITFNHDLVIENEIYRRRRLRPRWCIDEGYGSLSAKMTRLPPDSSLPSFPEQDDALCDHGRPITILKLHGSLNWLIRIRGETPRAPMC
jgi:hypothetical protein